MSEMTIYGRRDDVLDLSKRLQATIPGGRKLTQDEALSLAQLSVAHGLDPFNGEAWIIPGSGLMVGIKGLRKAARRAAKEEDSVYWTEFISVLPSEYGEPETSIVYECRLRDTVTIQAWSKAVNILTTSGMPYQEAVDLNGPAPLNIGIGIADPEEKSKMPIHQRAKKRAEADALKQRYDVALNAEFSEVEPAFIEAEFENESREPRSEPELLEEIEFNVETEPEPKEKPNDKDNSNNTEEIYQAVVDAGLSENIHAAKNALAKCKTGYETPEKAIAWMRLYRGWRDTDDKKTVAQAAKQANAGEVPK